MSSKKRVFKSVRGHYEPAYYLSDSITDTRAYQSLHSPLRGDLETWEEWNANVEEVLTRPSPLRESHQHHAPTTPVGKNDEHMVARVLLGSVDRAGSQPGIFVASLGSTTSRNGKTVTPKSTRRSRLALYRSAMEYKRGEQTTQRQSLPMIEYDRDTPSLVARSASRSSLRSSTVGSVYGSDIFDCGAAEEQVGLITEETAARTSLLFEFFSATADIQQELTAQLISMMTSAQSRAHT